MKDEDAQKEYVLTDRDIIVTKTNLQGNITYVNDDLLRITGFSEEELTGTNHRIFRHPTMPALVFKNLWQTISHESTWSGVIKNKTKNGGYYWVHADVAPLYENNKLAGYMSVRVKPTEAELSRAKYYYDQMNAGTFNDKLLYGTVVENSITNTIKRKFDDISISTKFWMIIGLSVTTLVAQAVLDNNELSILTNKHLDTITQIQQYTSKSNFTNQIIKTNDVYNTQSLEYFHQLKNKNYLTLLDTKNRTMAMGVVLVALMVFFHTIIIRSIEQPLRDAREKLKDISNGGYRGSINYRSKNEIGYMFETLRATSVRLGYDVAHEQKISAKIIKAHEKTQLLNDQVNQLQRIESIGRMTAGLAHNFNNILGSIIGYNQLNIYVSDDCENEELKKELLYNTQQIHESSAKAVELVKRMMEYTGQRITRSLADTIRPTNDIIDEVVRMMQPCVTSSCQIISNINVSVTAQIDSYDLNQILTNLIVNAKDAIGDANGKITISLDEVSAQQATCSSCLSQLSGDFIELQVSDNGSGIEKDIITHIFDPFYTTKKVGQGTGLGLSTVCGMIHESGGHIIVETDTSDQNHGTKFRLLFPTNKK